MIQTLERDWLGAWQERREERMEVGACKLGWNPRRAWASGARTDELEGGKHQEREVSERRALGLGGGGLGLGDSTGRGVRETGTGVPSEERP